LDLSVHIHFGGTILSIVKLGSDKLTKDGSMPIKAGQCNNQLATAGKARADEGRWPEDLMAMAPLKCIHINEGICLVLHQKLLLGVHEN
jgi:hypothetical protein